MRLKALDQIHLSAVRPDSLRAGEEFDVSDALGDDLMQKHPTLFEHVGATAAKAAPAPINKADAPPANKSTLKRPRK